MEYCATNAGDYSIPATWMSQRQAWVVCMVVMIPVRPRLGLVGEIDEVRIYNRALTTCEVQQLYQIESGISFGSPRIDLGKAVYPKILKPQRRLRLSTSNFC